MKPHKTQGHENIIYQLAAARRRGDNAPVFLTQSNAAIIIAEYKRLKGIIEKAPARKDVQRTIRNAAD